MKQTLSLLVRAFRLGHTEPLAAQAECPLLAEVRLRQSHRERFGACWPRLDARGAWVDASLMAACTDRSHSVSPLSLAGLISTVRQRRTVGARKFAEGVLVKKYVHGVGVSFVRRPRRGEERLSKVLLTLIRPGPGRNDPSNPGIVLRARSTERVGL